MTGKTRDFTLLELLIVISIIAILSSLLLPALGKARGNARTMVCANSMKQIGVATLMYVDDSEGYFIPYYAENPDYFQLLLLANKEYLPRNSWNSKKTGLLWCQSNLESIIYFSYFSNYSQNSDAESNPSKAGVLNLPFKINSIVIPSAKVMFAESGTIPSTGMYYFHGTAARVGWIHSGGANFLFMDGHVLFRKNATEEMFDIWN